MKKKLLIYLAFVLFFVLLTPVFMQMHGAIFHPYGIVDRLQVLLYSLPHDLVVSAWVMLLPCLLGFFYVYIRGDWHRRFMIWYIPLASIPVILLWSIDVVLYGFWGFRLDTTPLIYILDDPLTALAESPIWAPFASVALISVLFWGLYHIMLLVYPRRRSGSASTMSYGARQQREAVLNALLFAVMLVLANGGVGPWRITMGTAYFSPHQPLNHAATNPLYSFFHSLSQQSVPLAQQYRFMSKSEASQAFTQLNQPTEIVLADTLVTDSLELQPLLTTTRPDILLILFESFSGSACQYLYPEAHPDIMPAVNRSMREGLAFTRFYANSFRTERGLVSVLSSYPGQPTYTLMTDTMRCKQLSYLPLTLAQQAGYHTQFTHGGDATFTGLGHYLRCAGIDQVTSVLDFPRNQRLCQWGVHDELIFAHVADQLILRGASSVELADSTASPVAPQPLFQTLLTLSSHEPFEVPFDRFPDDPYLNSVAYTDHCFGQFIDKLKAHPEVWDNLLIIGMPDHCYAAYPQGIQQYDPLRYHIPMFWTGGAVAMHRDIETLGQQTDLTATLLSELGALDASAFPFSHSLLSPTHPHYAFYAWPDGFGMLTTHASYVQDNARDGYGLQPGTDDPAHHAERFGKAYLQTLYDDLSAK